MNLLIKSVCPNWMGQVQKHIVSEYDWKLFNFFYIAYRHLHLSFTLKIGLIC